MWVIHALRSLIERPDLELVGVHAHGADKIGVDAGRLCGLDLDTGIVATDDLDALIALQPPTAWSTPIRRRAGRREAIAELVRFLESGTNVVSTSLVWLVYPPHADSWMVEPLTCRLRPRRHHDVRERHRSRLLR